MLFSSLDKGKEPGNVKFYIARSSSCRKKSFKASWVIRKRLSDSLIARSFFV